MIIETIEHNEHIIQLCYDDSHDLNPFNDNDAMPAVVYTNDGLTTYNDYNPVSPQLTDKQLRDNADLILQTMNDPDFTKHTVKNKYNPDLFRQGIDDFIEYGASDRETIELLYVLNQAAGIPCVLVDGHGYTQGDWHKILIMLDPGKLTDYPDPDVTLQAMAKEYELWAYGNVYGYRVFKQNTCKCCGHTALEDIDSCWGFLCEQGDATWQYMIECAKEVTT